MALNAPTLTEVGHTKRHPWAKWTLPQYVEPQVVEVATMPETASDGQFFEENRVIFDLVLETDTEWLYERQLDPGTYYVHVRAWDNSCFKTDFATECGAVVSNALTLVIPRIPAYRASVRSIHPGAISQPGSNREWTYLGDTVRVSFRDATAKAGKLQSYRVCFTKNRRLSCSTRMLSGPAWDRWRLRIMPPWAGYWRGRYVRWIEFTFRVAGKVVAKQRIWVYE